MFVIILSSFNLSNDSSLECSANIKLLNVCNIRKEIYSYLKKNKDCGFPLITNYLSKEDYKAGKNVLQRMYHKFTDLEKNYSANNLGSLSVYNASKSIHISLKKNISKDLSNDKDLIRMEMNDLVLRISNILLENMNNTQLSESFKKIRLADKYINNFITHRSDYNFIYRLYKEKETRSPHLSNEDLNNLLVSTIKN
jgi:hypothetical protein